MKARPRPVKLLRELFRTPGIEPLLVGRRTFGKGLVQQLFPIEDGSELRLTAWPAYHTPSGRMIQSPYRMGEKEAYYKDFLERYRKGE